MMANPHGSPAGSKRSVPAIASGWRWVRTCARHVFQALFLVLDHLIPTDRELVGFGSDSGLRFSGNPKALFLYFRQQGNLRCFWLTRSPELHAKLRCEFGDEIVSTHTFRGLFMLARAGWFFASHGRSDYGLLPIEHTTRVIQTWHGKPYKQDGLLLPQLTSEQACRLRRDHSARYYAMTASSPYCRYYVSASFGVDVCRVLPFGYPRDDLPLGSQAQSGISLRLPGNRPKVALYAPTYRDQGAIKWFPFPDRDLDALNAHLEHMNLVILLRAHSSDPQQEHCGGYSHIAHFGSDVCEDVTDVLQDVDILITDYSSIYLDFLRYDRPCIFLDYDLDTYKTYRGITLDRGFLAAGPSPRSQEEFVRDLRQAVEEPQLYTFQRQRTNQLINVWSDGKSCERFYRFVLAANCTRSRALPIFIASSLISK